MVESVLMEAAVLCNITNNNNNNNNNSNPNVNQNYHGQQLQLQPQQTLSPHVADTIVSAASATLSLCQSQFQTATCQKASSNLNSIPPSPIQCSFDSEEISLQFKVLLRCA